MNLKRIDAALKAYEELLASTDWERLKFFRGLWEVQDALNKELGERPDYKVCPEDVKAWYWSNTPLFSQVPLIIDEKDLSKAASSISHYIVECGGFDKEVAQQLNSFDWPNFIKTTQFNLVGQDPTVYIASVCELLDEARAATNCQDDGESPNSTKEAGAYPFTMESTSNKPDDETSKSESLADVIPLVLAFSLRPLLEQAAVDGLSTIDVTKELTIHNKPLRCPACGSSAAAAFVGETPSGLSNGRLLYCALCGSEWEFERIRCACCGTTNQGHLHYYHLEGDEAHRLHSCDECGGYMRTTFQDSLAAPLSFEVEDVVMTKLDAAAQGGEK